MRGIDYELNLYLVSKAEPISIFAINDTKDLFDLPLSTPRAGP
jgi:hypothetical protein